MLEEQVKIVCLFVSVAHDDHVVANLAKNIISFRCVITMREDFITNFATLSPSLSRSLSLSC